MTDVNDSVRPLFISVHPQPEESLISVLVRASDANVMGRLNRFREIAGIRNPRMEYIPFTGFEHANVIAGLLDVPADAVLKRMHPARSDDAGEYVDWYGTRLPRRWIETRAMRFSPASLAATDHHKAVWSIKALTYCPASMEALVAVCSNCGFEPTWATARSTTRCVECNRPFANMPTEKVCIDLQDDARRVADLVSPDGVVRAEATQHLPAVFSAWEPGDVFHAAVELGFIANNPWPVEGCIRWKSMTRGGFKDYSVDDIVAGYRFLRDWPESLEAHLTQLALGRSATTGPLMGTMGKYFGQNASLTPIGDLLRAEVPVLLRKIDAPIRANQFSGTALSRSEGTSTATEIADIFSIDKKVVARLSTSSKCCVAKSAVGSGVTLYRQAGVEGALKLWREGVNFDQAARMLGTPTYCTEALLDAGLLVEITDRDALLLSEGTRLVAKASVEMLGSRLEELPLARGVGSEAVPFLAAMQGVLHPNSWAAAIEGLLQGQIKLAGLRELAAPVLNRILVPEPALEQLKLSDEAMAVPEIAVSGVVAADILGVSNTLVSGAVRLGLVRGKKTKRRIEIPLSEVRRYRHEFIGADEVTRKIGVRSQEFAAVMRANGFEPLGQAYNTYFWRRSDAELLYPSRL